MFLFLCRSREAPEVESHNAQAYRDTQGIDQISLSLYYSSIAPPFATL